MREETDLKLGIEMDFVPGREDRIANQLDGRDWDYVVGSIHFLRDHSLDTEDYSIWGAGESPEKVWRRYFDTLAESARSGLYDIIGHPDLVKVWGRAAPIPDGDLRRYYEPAVEAFAETGVAVELSTAGWRKPVGEQYPAVPFLEMLVDAGCPIALSSDAHTAEQLGFEYERAVELLETAGVREIAVFERRRAAAGAGRVRTGIGIDSHRFEEGRRLVLGGVEIPFERGLAGHSDADVLAHAIADALLGAAGLGDIGQQFPDTEEAWKDADSMELLRDVVARVRAAGHELVHVDATVMLEQPKLAPHREAIHASLGAVLGSVNVKATTGEGMGFVGRGEGAAALAVAATASA